MQTEKSQPEGTRIMPETRFTEYPALPIDLRVGISRSASVSDADREIPTQGYTDNAGNEVHRVSGIIHWPSGWDFSVCIGHRCLLWHLNYYLSFVIYFLFDSLRRIKSFSERHSVVTSLLKYSVLTSFLMSPCELSQPMRKTKFPSTAKNRTNSVS